MSSFVFFVGISFIIQINEGSFKFNNMILWICVFFGFACLSIIWAPSNGNVLSLNTTFLQLIFIVFCLTNIIKNDEDIELVLKCLIYSLLFTAIMLLIRTPFEQWGTERIGESIGLNSNDVGFRFAIGIILSFYFVNTKKKYYYIIYIIAFMLLVIFSGSRKGFIMAVVGIIVSSIYSGRKNTDYKAILSKLLKIVFASIALILIAYFVMNNKIFYSIIGVRMEDLFSAVVGESSGDASIIERNFFKEQAWQLFLSHPFIGYGHNCFPVYLKSIGYGFLTYSHNNYLELLSSTGIVGFAIYYSMIISMMISLLKMWFCKKKNGPILFVFTFIMLLVLFISWWQVNYSSKFLIVIYSLVYMFIKVEKKGGLYNNEFEKTNHCNNQP